ncbi:MAG: S8 family serine peptidase [Capsulimonadales bacterium]|nr:S8 family serine peptidase [Capsulimonadales bacterium]
MLAGLAVTLCLASLAFAGDPPVPKIQAGEIIVKVAPGTTIDAARQLAADSGCELLRSIPYAPNYYVFRAVKYGNLTEKLVAEVDDDTRTAIGKLKSVPGVLAADPNYIINKAFVEKPVVPLRPQTGNATTAASRATAPPDPWRFTPNDALYGRQYGLPMIRMPEAWSIQSSARRVIVGVADSGIDVGHPDFATADGTGTRIVGGRNFFPDGTGGAVDPNDIQDRGGHGTHVSGTVGATTNNAIGVASVAGYNGGGVDVQFRVARVFGQAVGATTDVVVSGVGYLVDQNVDVINLSLGGYGDVTAMRDVIARGIAQGITIVASLGNDGFDTAQLPSFPASYPGVIAVSAVSIDRRLASYSNFGGVVAIGAPGGDTANPNINLFDQQIWSTWPRTEPNFGGVAGYEAISGTSMAAPHVTGAVALLLAAGAPRNPATIKAVLQDNAQRLPDDVPNNAGGNKYGAGLLDVYSALLNYADPAFRIGFVGDLDLGSFYSSQLPAFQVRAIGITRAPAAGAVRIEIQSATIPVSVVRTLVEGTDFTIPRTLGPSQPKATVVTVTAGGANLNLAPGRYKAVLKIGDEVFGNQFFEIISRTQTAVRSLFSFPFKVRSVIPTNPEQAVFNPAVFSLARYNSQRSATGPDYLIYRSNGSSNDPGARFSATFTDNSPIVFEVTDPTTSIAPVGLGYWLDLDRPVTLNTVGPVAANAVGIRLTSAAGGWNLIGAPFTKPSAWGTVSVLYNNTTYSLNDAIIQGVISSALVGYVNGDYVYNIAPNGNLEPFQGYWVHVLRDCTLIIAPTNVGRSVTGLVPTRQAITQDKSGWRARFMATVAGDRDGQNYFGQASSASEGNDLLDIPKPPTGSGHAYVRFLTPVGEGRSVPNAFDIRPLDTGSKTEWTAAVSTDRINADVTVTWDGLGNVPRRNILTLTDTATGRKIDMRNRSSYTFKSGEAGTTRKFTITLSSARSAGLLAINNVAVSGGRSTAQAGIAVRFSVTAEAEITGTIKSLTGVKVGSLTGVSRAVTGGTNTLRWDGRSQSGAVLPPGPYLLEITARSADGQTATFKQPVQMMH